MILDSLLCNIIDVCLFILSCYYLLDYGAGAGSLSWILFVVARFIARSSKITAYKYAYYEQMLDVWEAAGTIYCWSSL